MTPHAPKIFASSHRRSREACATTSAKPFEHPGSGSLYPLTVLNTIHSTEYVDHYLGGTLLIRDPIPFLTGNTVLGSISVYARRALSDEWLAAVRLRLSRRAQ